MFFPAPPPTPSRRKKVARTATMSSSVINVRLNEQLTLKFVELYRDERLLWDKQHESYGKRTDRLRAYKRIADCMGVQGLGVSAVAGKIKNIRSTYLQELKKIREFAHRQQQIGGGGNDSDDDEDNPPGMAVAAASGYVPKLVWFPILDSMIGDATVKRLKSSPSTAELLVSNHPGNRNFHKTRAGGFWGCFLAT